MNVISYNYIFIHQLQITLNYLKNVINYNQLQLPQPW